MERNTGYHTRQKSCGYLQEIDKHILEHHGFHVDHSKTVFYGICQDCSRAEEEK